MGSAISIGFLFSESSRIRNHQSSVGSLQVTSTDLQVEVLQKLFSRTVTVTMAPPANEQLSPGATARAIINNARSLHFEQESLKARALATDSIEMSVQS